MGDINCNLLAVEQEISLNVEHNNTKRVVDLYQFYGLTQLISESTRESCHTTTLIDHIAISAARRIGRLEGMAKVLAKRSQLFTTRFFLQGTYLKA